MAQRLVTHLVWLVELLTDLTVQLVGQWVGVLLLEIQSEIPPRILVISHLSIIQCHTDTNGEENTYPIVEFGDGISLQIHLAGIDLGVDVLDVLVNVLLGAEHDCRNALRSLEGFL